MMLIQWTVWFYKLFYRLQIVKTKEKVKSWVNLSWLIPEKSDKIITRKVGDQILKFLLPTEKITCVCEYASMQVGICNPALFGSYGHSLSCLTWHRVSLYTILSEVPLPSVPCRTSQVYRGRILRNPKSP